MQTENRLLDDLSRVATGAITALAGVRDEVEAKLKEQIERVLQRLDLVKREEFEAVKAMATRAREAQEALEARLAALEARLGGPPESAPAMPVPPAPEAAAAPPPPAPEPPPVV